MQASEFSFRRKANRFAVFFKGHGLVPVADSKDDRPEFETEPPHQIGDEAIIWAEGLRRRVMLLRSQYAYRNETYLVDMGPA